MKKFDTGAKFNTLEVKVQLKKIERTMTYETKVSTKVTYYCQYLFTAKYEGRFKSEKF